MTSHARSIEEIAASTGGPPPDFLTFRANQLRSILDLSEADFDGKTVLEIGGGVSGQSLIMSEQAAVTISIDLPDPETVHSGGKGFLQELERASPNHLFFAFASAERMPFRDRSVDIVFSSFVFEHITDRVSALQEIKRVLRDDGVVITNVPNVMEPVFRSIWYFLIQVPKQLLKLVLHISGVARLMGKEFVNAPADRSLSSSWTWVRKSLEYPPHGEYPSHMTEIASSRPSVWDRLLEAQGFAIESRFAIAFESYAAFFRSRPALRLQRALGPFVLRFGRTALLRRLGTSYCMVARKSR